MKNVKISTTRKFVLIIASVMMLFYVSSCARKISFQPSSVVPAAQGSVKVTKDKNEKQTTNN